MDYSRRKFFRQAGAAAAGAFILPALGCKHEGSPASADSASQTPPPASTGSIPAYGIQLWSVRDDMAKDPKGTLKALAGYGYKQIESFEGDKGIFWGMTNLEFRDYLGELGMTVVAAHCDTTKDFEKKAMQAAEIGIRYLVKPWQGPQKTMAEWKKIAEEYNRLGEICRKTGIRFAYHNHAYTFHDVEGQTPQNFLMENTDPTLVDFEMDIYWVVTGLKDPIEYLQKYPGRFRLCHVKDRSKSLPDAEQDASCDLGTGRIDFPKVLNVAKQQGMEYFLVEQERWDNSTPLKSAEVDAAYMNKLVFA
jgi:sugar phosphate isomerase/epimerase